MNILDRDFLTGPKAIGPLWPDGIYYAAWDGNPILKHGEFNKESQFKTAEEAIEFATQYGEYLKSQ